MGTETWVVLSVWTPSFASQQILQPTFLVCRDSIPFSNTDPHACLPRQSDQDFKRKPLNIHLLAVSQSVIRVLLYVHPS